MEVVRVFFCCDRTGTGIGTCTGTDIGTEETRLGKLAFLKGIDLSVHRLLTGFIDSRPAQPSSSKV